MVRLAFQGVTVPAQHQKPCAKFYDFIMMGSNTHSPTWYGSAALWGCIFAAGNACLRSFARGIDGGNKR
jgi:hypothetical protein